MGKGILLFVRTYAASAVFTASQILVNRGLLLFSKNEFVAAQESFEGAAELTAAVAKAAPPRQSEGGSSICLAYSAGGG